MNNQNEHRRPKFNLEFKQDAAMLVIHQGYTHQQAADSLGVSLSAMGRCVRAERNPAIEPNVKNSQSNLSGQTELIRLRKENKALRMEREILKKAAVFFAK